MKIAIYCRVSTGAQDTDLQRKDLLQYAQARGWASADIKIYEDIGTGTNDQRAALNQLMVDARARTVDCIVVWKLDRFARSLKNLLNNLQELSDLGVVFISLKDSVDFSTASGRLMVHMIAAFGEFEAALIQERVNAGLRNAKAQGRKLGRPAILDPVNVSELRRQGFSLMQIARYCGVSKSAVSKTLTNLARKNRQLTSEPQLERDTT